MDNTVALLLNHVLGFRPPKLRRLPHPAALRLRQSLARLVSQGRELWQFEVAPSGPVGELLETFQLYGALYYLYTGSPVHLAIAGPGQQGASSNLPWLKLEPLSREHPVIKIDELGRIAAQLPELPNRCCTSLAKRRLHLATGLLQWLAQKIWNFPALRPGQHQIMARLLQGQNALGILPTGAGKSLCFQLPALLLPGVTLVVSPLKSLMRDQAANLRAAGIAGTDFIDSSKTPADKQQVLARLQSGKLKLLYISPERLQIESFQQELKATLSHFPISLFAIDEAHCISEWGHDFRPSYLRLRQYIDQSNTPPICALTATASNQVRRDILTLLGLNTQDIVLPRTLDRREISLAVRPLDEDNQRRQVLADTLAKEIPLTLGEENLEAVHSKGTGIIFAPYAAPRGQYTRAMGTVEITRDLRRQGLDCRHYHGQLGEAQRMEIQDEFKLSRFPLLVATKGYGMGIDKEDIDYIIHFCAPASLEAYYQEAGRAGRDGNHAHSVIITRLRHPRCEEDGARRPHEPLPPCHRGWVCTYQDKGKCDYGIQAGLLALEYPPRHEIISLFQQFLDTLARQSRGTAIRYICPAKDSSRHLKYFYYLQQLGAVQDFRVLEYRHAGANTFDLLLAAELAAPDSLSNRYWLANKVVERIETYKAQKLQMLDNVQTYLKTTTCRRRFLMQYFGDSVRYQQCNFCDNESIAPQATATGQSLGHRDMLHLLDGVVARQDLASAVHLVADIRALDLVDDARVRSLRELEDRPGNPAALFLAGLFSLEIPEHRAYGMRNMYSLLSQTEASQAAKLLVLVAETDPDAAYVIGRQLQGHLDRGALQALAARLIPPARYPDIHLALLLPVLRKAANTLNKEVASGE